MDDTLIGLAITGILFAPILLNARIPEPVENNGLMESLRLSARKLGKFRRRRVRFR